MFYFPFFQGRLEWRSSLLVDCSSHWKIKLETTWSFCLGSRDVDLICSLLCIWVGLSWFMSWFRKNELSLHKTFSIFFYLFKLSLSMKAFFKLSQSWRKAFDLYRCNIMSQYFVESLKVFWKLHRKFKLFLKKTLSKTLKHKNIKKLCRKLKIMKKQVFKEQVSKFFKKNRPPLKLGYSTSPGTIS